MDVGRQKGDGAGRHGEAIDLLEAAHDGSSKKVS